MKIHLFYFFIFLSKVLSGIQNDITIYDNNTIYFSHTANSLIYKLNSSLNYRSIIGTDGFFGDRNISFNGKEMLLIEPTSIISTDDYLFFVDNNIKIKRSKIFGNNARGEKLQLITHTTDNIFNSSFYGFATSNNSKDTIYFVEPKSIYEIKLLLDVEDIMVCNFVTKSDSEELLDNQNFIDISYHNSKLYYCYKQNSSYIFKESQNNHNYNISSDQQLTVSYSSYISEINGFVINDNSLILTGKNSANNNVLVKYNFNGITASHVKTENIESEYISLIDYKAVYNDTNYNDYIIGIVNKQINYQYEKININNYSDVQDIEIKESVVITMKNSLNIDMGYLYNSRILENNRTSFRVIYFDRNTNNIEIINCQRSNFETKRLNFKLNSENFTFGNIKNITIDSDNKLYIADYKDSISTIYTVESVTNNNETNYNMIELSDVDGEILAINYANNQNQLHFITNQSYNIYNNNDSTFRTLDNIRRTNDTDNLNDIKDFVMDNNFEIGYIAFETRLKWFYL